VDGNSGPVVKQLNGGVAWMRLLIVEEIFGRRVAEVDKGVGLDLGQQGEGGIVI